MKVHPSNSTTVQPRKRLATARSRTRSDRDAPNAAQWTFLTNHAHVLILLARDPNRLLREVARDVGITERGVQRIIADLEAAGTIQRQKVGRQNRYRVNMDQPLRHPIETHRTIADLIEMDKGHGRAPAKRG